MKKSGRVWRVLMISVSIALVVGYIAIARSIWVRRDTAIFRALSVHDNARVIALLNSGVDPNSIQ